MREEPALNLGQIEPIGNQNVNPGFVVLKREIEDESPRECRFLFKLIIKQIENILVIDRISLLQLSNNKFLNSQQPLLGIALLIHLRRVLLEKLGPLEQLLHHTLNTNIHQTIFLCNRPRQRGLPRFRTTNHQQL